MTDHTSAAAYVLGALSSAERTEFETHLAECADCRQTVAELAGIPGLLSRVSPTDLAEQPPLPDTLVPRLLRSVRRTMLRRRLVMGGLAAAAAVLAVLGTLVVVQSPSDGPSGVAMSAVVTSPIRATAALTRHGWGTEITMDCSYEGEPDADRPYLLVVVGKDGTEHEIATWTVGPSRTATATGSVDLQPAQIDRIEVRTASGKALLRLSPST
jgi:hypothetical protein